MENSNKCSGNVFNINDCVVYGSAGVCRLTGIEKQCFDGEHEMDYFILSPLHSSTSKYYLPVNKCSNKIRKLLTKDEIISLIDSAAKSDVRQTHTRHQQSRALTTLLYHVLK